ncbi:MAG: ATP-binding protein [Planctomycetota bacterium]
MASSHRQIGGDGADVPSGGDADSVQSELHELSSIFEVSSRIGSFRDEDRALRFIVHSACECLDADASSVLTREGGELEVRAVAGESMISGEGARVRMGEGIAGWVAERRRPLLVTSRRDLESFLVDPEIADRLDSVLCVPLLKDGEPLGAITVERHAGDTAPRLRERHLKLLQIFADYAASTIAHLRMVGEIEGAHSLLAKSYNQMRQMQEQLVQAEKMSAIGQLISEVSHELNNPLTAVVGYSQLLTKVNRDPETGEFLETIRTEADRCKQIIRNLLDFSRKNQGHCGPVDLNELIVKTIALRRYQLNIDGITVETDLAPKLPSCTAEPSRLQQVILNLLNNARHAIVDGGGAGVIRFTSRYEAEHERVTVEVADTGPGVAEGIRERIFEPFFTTKESGQGTGLGLSICRGILVELGGSIGAEEGDGGRFVLTLPVGTPAEIVPSSLPISLPAPVRGSRILVVDDDPKVRGLLLRVLKLDGHDVTVAANGREALRLLDRDAFELVLTDLMMPGLSGRQFYDEIVRRHGAMGERVVFFTGAVLTLDQERFFREVGRIVLRKPFKLDEVRGAIRQALGEVGEPADVRQFAD